MSYSIRYQVFVSSTFTDLIHERAEVIQAVWELDCIPTGMEAFVASNESQWDVIKRVIQECDYYVLIVGGRYGSITDEGVSYTEKEYRYAQELGIPILAFVHANPEDIAVGRTEKDQHLRDALERFRNDVMKRYPVRGWTTASELGGVVSRSLIREIKVNPRPGWIRNDGSSPIALLEQVNRLTEENRQLRNELIDKVEVVIDSNLEQGRDEVELWGEWRLRHKSSLLYQTDSWSCKVTWDDVFRDVGPALINEATEDQLKQILARFHLIVDVPRNWEIKGRVIIGPENWNEVVIQLRALGLITPGVKKRGVNDNNSYWAITPHGDKYLVGLLARKRKDSTPSKASS